MDTDQPDAAMQLNEPRLDAKVAKVFAEERRETTFASFARTSAPFALKWFQTMGKDLPEMRDPSTEDYELTKAEDKPRTTQNTRK